MFWGLNLKANRKYTQTTSKSFHISQAALDSSSSQGGPTQIFLTHEDQKFLICTLRKDSCEQATLDLNFAEGDELSFQSQGSGNVTLSGYLIESDPMSFMDGEEEEESDIEEARGDLREALNMKSKKNRTKAEVAPAANDEDDDEDDDDSDFNSEAVQEGEDDSDEEEDGDDDDDDEENDAEENDDDEDDVDEEENDADESEEEIKEPKAKQPKLEKSQKQQNGIVKDNAEKRGKKEKKKDNHQQQPQQQRVGNEKVLSGGVKIEDIRIGNGAEAKSGKRAIVYYEGRLKSNNKVFDSLKQGAGFKFSLGRGEVIKGWDIGVSGMKIGGKRRITCPPHMAYGARGSPPTIPPNSTLVFEVELKGVN